MGFPIAWARALRRADGRALVGISLLLALIGGLALFTLAGARRTQSAYPRFLRSARPSTLAVDVGSLQQGGYDAINWLDSLPQVSRLRAYAAFDIAAMTPEGPDLTQNFEALGSMDGRYFDQDVFTPVDGRRPDPNKPDEIAVNREAARRYGYHVGQTLDLGTVSDADLQAAASAGQEQSIVPRLRNHATVVGVGAFVEEVMQDDTDRSPLVLLTPAFVQEAKGLETYAWVGLLLRNGRADVDAVKRQVADAGGPQIFRETGIDEFHAEQAIRPISLALAGFGGIAGIAALTLVAQACSRLVQAHRGDRAVARALGAGPTTISLGSAIGPAVAVVAGAVLAAVVAVLASPAMPVGPVRRFEAGPGFDVDWTVMGFGAAALAVLCLAALAVSVWREQPHRVQRRTRSERHRSLVGRVPGLAPSMSMGLRLALERGEGTTAVPVRSVIAASALAVAALVAALTFGASLSRLVDHPQLFGWNWDVAMVDGSGYGNVNPQAVAATLGHDPDIAGWGGAFYGADDIEHANVPLLGMDPQSAVTPTIRSGRMIEGPGEIVLGTATIAQLHKAVGDTVSSSSGDLKIVGTATFPSIGVVHGDHTSLGVGGLVVPEQVPGVNRNLDPDAGVDPASYGANVLFVRYRDGADVGAVTERLHQVADQISDYQGVAVTPVQRSAEIVNADGITGSARLLGVAVAVASLASLTVALGAAVRRRRRDLALLKTLGFTRRQLGWVVAWQATGTIVLGLLIGIPLGLVAGRSLWKLFADQLDVLAVPATPVTAVLVVAAAGIVVANLLAAAPARHARRVPAALALRTE